MAVISARERWTRELVARRRAPTYLVSTKKIGAVAMATRVSCQDRISMATKVLTKITVLETESERVLVTTC